MALWRSRVQLSSGPWFGRSGVTSSHPALLTIGRIGSNHPEQAAVKSVARRWGKRMWYVYIVECCNGTFYTGITDNIEKRIKKHNSGKGAYYTKVRAPVKLIYQEALTSKSEAFTREQQIKRWSKAKKLALINFDKSKLIELSRSRD